MKNKGFTLIEMLVVVLIIGILAAIALPQYKIIILKSKFAKVKANVQALVGAMQRYYLTNNVWPTTLDVLDIEVKNKNDETYYTNNKQGDVGGDIRRNRKTILNYYIIFNEDNIYPENIKTNTYYCIAYDGIGFHPDIADMLNKLCQQETGKTEYSHKTATYTWYAY